jgi:hypothetical protein
MRNYNLALAERSQLEKCLSRKAQVLYLKATYFNASCTTSFSSRYSIIPLTGTFQTFTDKV